MYRVIVDWNVVGEYAVFMDAVTRARAEKDCPLTLGPVYVEDEDGTEMAKFD